MSDPPPLPDGLHEQFLSLLQRPASERTHLIEGLCREHPQHAEVLRHYLQATIAGSDPNDAEGRPGLAQHVTDVGPYHILDVLGEGGMGTVYLAEQKDPVRRRVALKVIKPGMDSKAVLARFGQERQALALMQHDGIAKVYDCGTTERGQPYFVMEYVKGIPLTDFCDRQRLSLKQRIQLMQQVCAAVTHAHQKGVVHRDLKPGNVLVSEEGGKVQIKIIDFGLAKAMGHKLVEATLFTEAGQIIGTPEYMAPEQADLTNADIDTRADVYSLGVMLYEVLVGMLPFSNTELRRAGLLEMQRILREVDPPKPSTRLTSAGDTASAVAQARRISVGALHKALHADLDWVVLKALEKDRARRYDTANALAADLQRYLDHEPLAAGPPSAWYRVKKLVRRYQGQVLAGSAVVVTAIAGALVAVDFALGKQQALASYERMRDVPLCDDLLAEAQRDLWPAHPERVPAMDAWLTRARTLIARADEHRRRLTELRLAAQPPSLAVAGPLRDLERLYNEREEQRKALERAQRSTDVGLQDIGARLNGLVVRVRNLEWSIGITSAADVARLRWRFETSEDRFRHETLTDLVTKLDQLTGDQGLLVQVEERRKRAATLRERSVESCSNTWNDTIAAVGRADDASASALYAGMSPLTPQLGLVPIGMDPDSKLHEFAVLDTGKVPGRDPAGRLVVDDYSAIVLVLVPHGAFHMGARRSQTPGPNRDPAAVPRVESPVAEIPLDAFFLSKYEMTQGQWQHVMEKNPSLWALGRPQFVFTARHPVENVSWHDCQEPLRRVGLLLPTEAQWEYAARAGTRSVWWTGDDKASIQGAANIADRHAEQYNLKMGSTVQWKCDLEIDDGHVLHAPVGSFRANAFGLHDMIGNVWEWCADEYGRYEVEPEPGDGLRRPADAPGDRVLRGGSFRNDAAGARSANRGSSPPDFRSDGNGLRAARRLQR